MPQYEQKYSENDFLEALGEGLRTLGGITKKVGCARMTCVTYMNNLVKSGKVEKLSVDDGQMFVYKRKATDEK